MQDVVETRIGFVSCRDRAFVLLFTLLLVVSASACDSAGSSDEDPLATKVALTISTEDVADAVSWEGEWAGGLTGGMPIDGDTLQLPGGASMSGEIMFTGSEGADLTRPIREEAERYQIFYQLSGLESTSVEADDAESDYGANEVGADLPVGLRISIETPLLETAVTGSIRVRVGRFPEGRKNGFNLTVDPLYDFVIPVKVVPPVRPAEPPTVTSFQWKLVRSDSLKEVRLDAARAGGLNLGGGLIGELVTMEECERSSVDEEYACTEVEELTFFQGEVYAGETTVGDSERGLSFTDYVREHAGEFRISYELPFSPTGLTYDEDADGLPIGLEIEWVFPTNIQIGGGRLTFRMYHYDEAAGGDKASDIRSAKLVDFAVRFNLTE